MNANIITTQPNRLPTARVIRGSDVKLTKSPRELLRKDLVHYASTLTLAATLPGKYHADALDLVRDWRVYGFEKNLKRWPDGRWYMVDRKYQLWRGHEFALTRLEVSALGVGTWSRESSDVASGPTFLWMEPTHFRNNPGRRLAKYARLVRALADAVHDVPTTDEKEAV